MDRSSEFICTCTLATNRACALNELGKMNEVLSILDTIVELGFVQFVNGALTTSVLPKFNIYSTNINPVYLDRWNGTILYLKDYARYHPQFEGSYFLCLYDGWREMTDPAEEADRVHIPWYSYSEEEHLEYFIGSGTIGEPRFYSRLDPTIYVDLPLPILAYSRHVGDRNVLLLPDHQFLESEFRGYIREVLGTDIPWSEKQSQILWRGSRHVNAGYGYTIEGYERQLAAQGITKIHPRELACSITNSVGHLTPDIGRYLNATYAPTSIEDMLQSKYLLDLDGMVNAWSGLFWKLYSNSVVFKLRSHWEEWYYNELKPYVHYIPLRNLSPLVVQEAFEWCEVHHREECERIGTHATDFARHLTYEYAVKHYNIH